MNDHDVLAGDTVLHWAAYGGSELTTRYLLDQWRAPRPNDSVTFWETKRIPRR